MALKVGRQKWVGLALVALRCKATKVNPTHFSRALTFKAAKNSLGALVIQPSWPFSGETNPRSRQKIFYFGKNSVKFNLGGFRGITGKLQGSYREVTGKLQG